MYILYLSTKNTPNDKELIGQIEHAKHKVWSLNVSGTKKSDVDNQIATLMKEIKKADACVVEATYPTFELGRFITFALQQHKPALMLQEETKISPLVLGESRLVTSGTYALSKKTQLQEVLAQFFKLVAKQRLLYRFNFMMSREMNRFVMEKSREEGISKADYIRTLILQEMQD